MDVGENCYLCCINNNGTMEIRQLRYFVNAASTMSFTDAARLSNVAQSTLSQQIKQLETELDVPLFHRIGKQIQLTAEGKMFLADAQRILDSSRQGLQRLADLRQLQEGSVTVGLASGLGLSSLITEVVSEYNKVYPRIQLKIRQIAAPLLPGMLRQHDIDLALTFTPSEIDEDLNAQPLFGTRMCAIVSEFHPIADNSTVSIKKMANLPLALPGTDLIIRQFIDAEARRQGIQLRPAVEINDLSHILSLVRNGKWCSMLPDAATLAIRGLVRIPLEERIVMPTSAITLFGDYQRKAVVEFQRMLYESARLLLHSKDEKCDVCGEKFLA